VERQVPFKAPRFRPGTFPILCQKSWQSNRKIFLRALIPQIGRRSGSRQSLEAANGAVIEMMEDSLLPSPCCSIPAGPCFIGAFARKNYSDLNQVANSRKFRQ